MDKFPLPIATEPRVPAPPVSALPQADLDLVLEVVPESIWRQLTGARIFVTGGTGFFGSWMARSFCHAVDRLGLDAEMTILVRNIGQAKVENPDIARHPALTFHQGNLLDFDFPKSRFTHCIHMATQSFSPNSPADAIAKVETNILGTSRVLNFAARSQVRRFLYTSSGAVYGPQPKDLSHLPEDQAFVCNPSNANEAYAFEKRTCEFLCTQTGSASGFQTSIARCFAFVGPRLPLDSNYAVGNFIRDALAGEPILIQGDGTPLRSYLHGVDLCAWLWTLLLSGQHGVPINVGSDVATDILALAHLVSEISGHSAGIRVLGRSQGGPPQRYVPSIRRAREIHSLKVTLPLAEALERTIKYYLNTGRSLK